MRRISARTAQDFIDRPGIRETFFGGAEIVLPEDDSVWYVLVPGGVVIFSPLNAVTHVAHVALNPGERKFSGLVMRQTVEWFRKHGGQKVIVMIPAVHRAAVGLAWNARFKLCGRIPNGCEHGELLIFEDNSWVSQAQS